MAWKPSHFIRVSRRRIIYNVLYSGRKRKLAQARFRKSLQNYKNYLHYRKWR